MEWTAKLWAEHRLDQVNKTLGVDLKGLQGHLGKGVVDKGQAEEKGEADKCFFFNDALSCQVYTSDVDGIWMSVIKGPSVG